MEEIQCGRIYDVENRQRRKFSTAAYRYKVVFMINDSEEEEVYMFTENQLRIARDRARRNEEDIPIANKAASWINRILGGWF
jgi:hypothetical protein